MTSLLKFYFFLPFNSNNWQSVENYQQVYKKYFIFIVIIGTMLEVKLNLHYIVLEE